MISISEEIMKDPGYKITKEEGERLACMGDEKIVDLMAYASRIRREFKGDDVFTCSITNAKSGRCSQDCAFCAQSGHHETGIETYPLMGVDQLVERALLMEDSGVTNYSMVTSGHMMTDEELDTICKASDTIKQRTGLTICASLGELTRDMAEKLFNSGVSNYHHNLETARSYFSEVCTTHDYDEDINTIKSATKSGLRVCSGGIMGLGETWGQRLELAFTLRDLNVDSIPLNFLNPIPGTKMEERPLLPPMEALKSVAIFRFVNPTKDITICGGREVTLGDFQALVFMAGANGLMVGNYLTTKGRDIGDDMEMIKNQGLKCLRG